MNQMDNRLDIIYELAVQKPGLGKTAMMKYLFLLQNVYNVPLDYDFEIYTYGPYSSEVMEDIDDAAWKNIITVKTELYSSGHVGYCINTKCKKEKESEFVASFKESIKDLLEQFGDRNAKELELSSTIVYLYMNARMNGWNSDEQAISEDVHEIKPHFQKDKIKQEYIRLYNNNILIRLCS